MKPLPLIIEQPEIRNTIAVGFPVLATGKNWKILLTVNPLTSKLVLSIDSTETLLKKGSDKMWHAANAEALKWIYNERLECVQRDFVTTPLDKPTMPVHYLIPKERDN